jgi:hypothetical protein
LKALQNFDISDNKITKLENLDNLKALQNFKISGNKITKLENLDNLNALQNFDISESFIKEISLSFWESKFLNQLISLGLINIALINHSYASAINIRKRIQNKNLDLNYYGNLSWLLIFCHDFEGAIWAGEKYVEKGGKSIVGISNLAMGYLYNGDYEKAYAIYSRYKNEKDEYAQIGKNIFLKNLEYLAEEKVPPKNPADVEKIKAFLEAQ